MASAFSLSSDLPLFDNQKGGMASAFSLSSDLPLFDKFSWTELHTTEDLRKYCHAPLTMVRYLRSGALDGPGRFIQDEHGAHIQAWVSGLIKEAELVEDSLKSLIDGSIHEMPEKPIISHQIGMSSQPRGSAVGTVSHIKQVRAMGHKTGEQFELTSSTVDLDQQQLWYAAAYLKSYRADRCHPGKDLRALLDAVQVYIEDQIDHRGLKEPDNWPEFLRGCWSFPSLSAWQKCWIFNVAMDLFQVRVSLSVEVTPPTTEPSLL